MRDTEVTKKHINAKAMTLAQAGEVLATARPILGELWETKIETLHSILADYFNNVATDFEQGCLLKLVSVNFIKEVRSSLVNAGTLFSTINAVEGFQRFLQVFVSPNKDEVHWVGKFCKELSAHTMLKDPSKKDFKALAEEIIILHNLDQANSKLSDVARTIEHITKTYE